MTSRHPTTLLLITYAKLYPSIPMLSFSYLRICALAESSPLLARAGRCGFGADRGAARAAAKQSAKTIKNFIFFRFMSNWPAMLWKFGNTLTDKNDSNGLYISAAFVHGPFWRLSASDQPRIGDSLLKCHLLGPNFTTPARKKIKIT